MPKLSIIVPIYNVEPYLSRCIDSILEQTYNDFELILINDGSPDRCAEIMEEYAKKDQRIVTIYQENKGVSAARNAGLKIAQGKYIGFVDPDDYIDQQCYEKMILALENVDADIACCNWDFLDIHGKTRGHLMSDMNDNMTQIEFVSRLFDIPRTLGWINCNKLFVYDKIRNLYDENLCVCEDNLFLMMYSLQIKKACIVNEPLYHVYERPNSASRIDIKKYVYALPVNEQVIYLAGGVDRSLRKLAEKDYLDNCYRLYVQLRDEDPKCTSEIKGMMIKYISRNFKSVAFNKEIFWKTRILYLMKYIQLLFK